MKPVRLVAVLTHPVQYFAPWFRHLTEHVPELALRVLYASAPTPAQQAVGFGGELRWDADLLAGYDARVLRPARPDDHFGADRLGLDAPELGAALDEAEPEALLVFGWHAAVQLRAIAYARRRRIPLIYRGDSFVVPAGRDPTSLLKRARTRLLLGQFAAHLAVGARARTYLIAHGVAEHRIFSSPHAVDVDGFAAAAARVDRVATRAALGLDPRRFVVAFVGKLEEKKRPFDLVEALVGLPDVQLAIVGRGPEESALRQRAVALGVDVVFCGFRNQGELGAIYAACDALALPSDSRETWGLVVNEALACGRPAIVSDAVGCAPDLVTDGVTGTVHALGAVAGLRAAIARLRDDPRPREIIEAECRARVRRFDYAAASTGLQAAVEAVARPEGPRVLACFGGMYGLTGLERMSLAALQAMREHGARVHAVVMPSGAEPIIDALAGLGASFSRGQSRVQLRWRGQSPLELAKVGADVARTSFHLVGEATRLGATHVLVPDLLALLRNAPALGLLRARGVRVMVKLGNAASSDRLQAWLWRRVADPVSDVFVCNSGYTAQSLRALAVNADKVRLVYNTAPPRAAAATPAPVEGRVLFVGQCVPDKGLDLLLEAVARLRTAGIPATLDVVGDVHGWVAPAYRAYRDAIVARANAPDLREHVRLLGWREDVPALMSTCMVHCCPSRPEGREAFGLVNVEAKRAARPSVVSGAGGIPELFSHRQDGWVCDPLSAETLAEGLAWFLTDRARWKTAGQAALASYSRFSWERFAEGWWQAAAR